MARGSHTEPQPLLNRGTVNGVNQINDAVINVQTAVSFKDAQGNSTRHGIRIDGNGRVHVTPPGAQERLATEDEVVNAVAEFSKRKAMAVIGHGNPTNLEPVALRVVEDAVNGTRQHIIRAQTQHELNAEVAGFAVGHMGHSPAPLSPEELDHHLEGDLVAVKAPKGNNTEMVRAAKNHAMQHIRTLRSQQSTARVGALTQGQGFFENRRKTVEKLGLVSQVRQMLAEKDDHGHALYSDEEVRNKLVQDGYPENSVNIAWNLAVNPENLAQDSQKIVKAKGLAETVNRLFAEGKSIPAIREEIADLISEEPLTPEEKTSIVAQALLEGQGRRTSFKRVGKKYWKKAWHAAKVGAAGAGVVGTLGAVAAVGATVKTVSVAKETVATAFDGVKKTGKNLGSFVVSPLSLGARVLGRVGENVKKQWDISSTPNLKPAGLNPLRGLMNTGIQFWNGLKKAGRVAGAATFGVLQGAGEGVAHDVFGIHKGGVNGGALGLIGSTLNTVANTVRTPFSEIGVIEKPQDLFDVEAPYTEFPLFEDVAEGGTHEAPSVSDHGEAGAHHRLATLGKGVSPLALKDAVEYAVKGIKGGDAKAMGDALEELMKAFDLGEGSALGALLTLGAKPALMALVKYITGGKSEHAHHEGEGEKHSVGHHFGETILKIGDSKGAEKFLKHISAEELKDLQEEFKPLHSKDLYDALAADEQGHHDLVHKLEALVGKKPPYLNEKTFQQSMNNLLKGLRVEDEAELSEEARKTLEALKKMIRATRNFLMAKEHGHSRIGHLLEKHEHLTPDYEHLGDWVMKEINTPSKQKAVGHAIDEGSFRNEYAEILGSRADLQAAVADADKRKVMQAKLQQLLGGKNWVRPNLRDIQSRIEVLRRRLGSDDAHHAEHDDDGHGEAHFDLREALAQLSRTLDANIVTTLFAKEIPKGTVDYAKFAENIINDVDGEDKARSFLKGLDMAKLRSDFDFMRAGPSLDAQMSSKNGRLKVKNAIHALFGVPARDLAQITDRVTQDLQSKFAAVSSDPKYTQLFGTGTPLGFYNEVLAAMTVPATTTPPAIPAHLKPAIVALANETPEFKKENITKFGEWMQSPAEEIREVWDGFRCADFNREYLTFLTPGALDVALKSEAGKAELLQKLRNLLGITGNVAHSDLSTLFGNLSTKLGQVNNLTFSTGSQALQEWQELCDKLIDIEKNLTLGRLEKIQGVKESEVMKAESYKKFAEWIDDNSANKLDEVWPSFKLNSFKAANPGLFDGTSLDRAIKNDASRKTTLENLQNLLGEYGTISAQTVQSKVASLQAKLTAMAAIKNFNFKSPGVSTNSDEQKGRELFALLDTLVTNLPSRLDKLQGETYTAYERLNETILNMSDADLDKFLTNFNSMRISNSYSYLTAQATFQPNTTQKQDAQDQLRNLVGNNSYNASAATITGILNAIKTKVASRKQYLGQAVQSHVDEFTDFITTMTGGTLSTLGGGGMVGPVIDQAYLDEIRL